ncbi:Hsp70 family protein [Candidatus Daviesbacteria bacterium]|nr:Hsp70 family protein [Candidatus Daviesbacteria bacterium]
MPKSEVSLGLDFGTSNSAIAAVQGDELKVIPVQRGSLSQPSCIFVDASQLFNSVGYAAITFFKDPDKPDNFHFIPSIKPGLPNPDYDGISLRSRTIKYCGQPKVTHYSPVALTEMVLQDLRRFANRYLDQTVENVVLGRPVRFSEKDPEDQIAQQRLERAAHNSGFQNIKFMYEPVAAALDYTRRHSFYGRNILIFDFGGGTLDVACLNMSATAQLNEKSLSSQVLAVHGIDIGGTDLDKHIFKSKVEPLLGRDVKWADGLPVPAHLFADITEWHLVNTAEKQEKTRDLNYILRNRCSDSTRLRRLLMMLETQHIFGVLQAIEKAKIDLSTTEQTRIEYTADGMRINMPITRREFDLMMRQEKREIELCIEECLRRAQLTPDNIAIALKVGGSSNNVFVNEILSKYFDTVEESDIFNSVVGGLAIAARELFR